MRKGTSFLLLIIILLTGCSTKETSSYDSNLSQKLDLLHEKYDALNESYNTLLNELADLNKEVNEKNRLLDETINRQKGCELFFEANDNANLFIKAYLQLDKQTMKDLVKSNINIEDNFISFNDSETQIAYISLNGDKYTYSLNGFGYDNVNEDIIIHYSIINEDELGGFINLMLVKDGVKWLVSNIELDI